MGGSLSERLKRAEEAAAKLNLAQHRCPDCGAAIPGIPEHLTIGSSGVLLMRKPCPTCFEQGGGAVPLDNAGNPTTDHYKLVMMFDPGSEVETFAEWVDKYGHLRFGSPIDAFLRVQRAQPGGQEDTRDLAEYRTLGQVTEARAATRYFPCWGGTAPEKLKGVKFGWED